MESTEDTPIFQVFKKRARVIRFCVALIASSFAVTAYAQDRLCLNGICIGDSVDRLIKFNWSRLPDTGQSAAYLQDMGRRYFPTADLVDRERLGAAVELGRYDGATLRWLAASPVTCGFQALWGITSDAEGDGTTMVVIAPNNKSDWRIAMVSANWSASSLEDADRRVEELRRRFDGHPIGFAQPSAAVSITSNRRSVGVAVTHPIVRIDAAGSSTPPFVGLVRFVVPLLEYDDRRLRRNEHPGGARTDGDCKVAAAKRRHPGLDP